MSNQQLSSDLTIAVKVIFPVIFYSTIISVIIGLIITNQYLGALAAFFIFLLFGSIIYIGLVGLKQVKMDSENIYISNFLKTIKIPIQDLESVSETWLINIHTIWLNFENEFGRSIMFMPKTNMASMFSTHPITKELNDLIKARNKKTPLVLASR